MTTSPARHLLASLAGIVVLAVAASLVATALGPASERILTVFFISLIAVVGMGLYSGNSGILSFGHLSFMGIGAYVSGLLTLPAQMKMATLPKLPDWLAATETGFLSAILIAVVVTSVLALIVGLALNRLEGSAATIATLGLLIITHGVIIGWRDVTRGSQSFFGVPRETTLWAAAVFCILALIAARLYRDSVSGLRLRAGRENAIAAGAVGVNIRKERLISWVLSAAIMALSGALIAHFLGAFSPKKFYFADTFLLLAMLIVGGMSTVTGAITGAVTITLVTEILRRFEGGFNLAGLEMPAVFGTTQIGIGLIILFAMFRKPEGLAGLKELEERFFPGHRVDPAQPAAAGAAKPVDPTPLQGQNLTMRFGGLVAVKDVSITVHSGEIVGLIGPNGSGKTTLLNMLSGVLAPSEGKVLRGDTDLTQAKPYEVANHGIARTFQNIRLFDTLTVYQNVLIAALSTNKGERATERCESAIQAMGISQFAGSDANTLSYGDQRRVEIARALACEPSLLFLDEPAAGMNREETDDLMATLQKLTGELGLGVLIVDHDLKLINQLCDRIIVLNEGAEIAQGVPEDIRKNPAVIEAYLGHS
ncbi:branched-chain amino acid ABC transporter ATP-binding protein/permease [Neptunicoccus sediminis]|uniref:branched-chain amino acid ABC transporter ATP-binding protein/permease n=1 Tax=Neptunicoccus sediminis TaxID=1892596 RepID=UPI000845DAAC|nr:branched-chain amino acid ABC transporter ATP-binding protein/permease [Neptunicoccus sediminis]